jgi:hypothetical protein
VNAEQFENPLRLKGDIQVGKTYTLYLNYTDDGTIVLSARDGAIIES